MVLDQAYCAIATPDKLLLKPDRFEARHYTDLNCLKYIQLGTRPTRPVGMSSVPRM